MEHNSLKGARTLTLMTGLSRILGMIRDILSAAIFGTSLFWDSFVIAFTLPNLFRRLFGEGALNAAFVPQFSEELVHDPQNAKNFAESMLWNLLWILLIVTFVIETLFFILKGSGDFSYKTVLMIKLSQILFPYVLFICLTALCMGILNSLGHFLYPSFAPILLNLLMITSMLIGISCQFSIQTNIYLLCVVVLLSGIIQYGLQWIPLHQHNIYFKINPLKNSKVKKTYQSMGPAMAGMAVLQLNLIIDRILAVLLPTGAVSILFYSERLMQLPLGIFAISISVSSLPLFSRLLHQKEIQKLQIAIQHSIQSCIGIILPATIGLFILSESIVRIIFERFSFNELATMRAAETLRFYSLGLLAFSLNKIFLQVFYSEKNYKTPFYLSALSLLINLILNLFLMQFLNEAGLAFATSITAYIQLAIITYLLHQKFRSWTFFINLKEMISTLICISLFYKLITYFNIWIQNTLTTLPELIHLLLTISFGIFIWFALGFLSGNQSILKAQSLIFSSKK